MSERMVGGARAGLHAAARGTFGMTDNVVTNFLLCLAAAGAGDGLTFGSRLLLLDKAGRPSPPIATATRPEGVN